MLKSYARYLERADELATDDLTPTMTDQSGAEDTDINVIVKRYGVYGTVPQGKTPPQFGQDFSQLPDDLRTAIETVRALDNLRSELPEGLQNLTLEDLLTYTPEAITRLAQPEPKPEPKPESSTIFFGNADDDLPF